MFKKLFSFSNPIGLIVSSAVLILTVSPKARKGTRKLLVKGAGAALALGGQVKGLTTGVQKQLGSFLEEAKEESHTVMPSMADMVKGGTEKVKHSVGEGIARTKNAFGAAKEKVGGRLVDVDIPQFSEESIPQAKFAMEASTDEGFSKSLFDKIEPVEKHKTYSAYNVLNDESIKKKINEIDEQFH